MERGYRESGYGRANEVVDGDGEEVGGETQREGLVSRTRGMGAERRTSLTREYSFHAW